MNQSAEKLATSELTQWKFFWAGAVTALLLPCWVAFQPMSVQDSVDYDTLTSFRRHLHMVSCFCSGVDAWISHQSTFIIPMVFTSNYLNRWTWHLQASRIKTDLWRSTVLLHWYLGWLLLIFHMMLHKAAVCLRCVWKYIHCCQLTYPRSFQSHDIINWAFSNCLKA